MYQVSLMPSLCMPPTARNGLVNKVDFWGPLLKVIKTNEIVRSLISMWQFPYNSKTFYLCLGVCTFFVWVWHKMFLMLLGYTRACTSSRNLTWFTKPSIAIKTYLPVKPTHYCISKHTLKYFNCTTLFLSFYV